MFSFRYFFTQEVNADDVGEGFSKGAIKAVLSKLLESEDSSRPYSDETVVILLKQRGIE
ncbi:RNA polymerase factor sigma-54, partial [Neisseria sp. P0014.S006]